MSLGHIVSPYMMAFFMNREHRTGICALLKSVSLRKRKKEMTSSKKKMIRFLKKKKMHINIYVEKKLFLLVLKVVITCLLKEGSLKEVECTEGREFIREK